MAKKAFETATKLDGLILVKIDDVYKTRVKHFEGSIPPFAERLMLLKTIYGLKQSAFEYWRVLLKAMRGLGLLRSKADPCVYYKWADNGLCIWTSWVDDLLSIGKEVDVHEGREKLKMYFS